MQPLALMLSALLAASALGQSPPPLQGARWAPPRLTPPLLLSQADAQPSPPEQPVNPPTPAQPPSSLDFDLLGQPTPQAAATAPAAGQGQPGLRRGMLKVHQGIGIGLLVFEVSTVVLGQLNYYDRFGGGDRSARYTRAHAALAYSTFTLFVTNGLIGLLAPSSDHGQSGGVDRVVLHKAGMFTASAGMLAQVVLGIVTAELPGHGDQRTLAQTHLFIGYGTLLFMLLGVSALVF